MSSRYHEQKLRWSVAIALALTFQAPDAPGRTEAGSSYTKAQTYSAALRYLRVDQGYEIIEKDPDAAYLLFRFPVTGQNKSANGSVEVVETSDGVKIFVQLPRLPSYHEVLLRDGLLKKLREEYGEPPKKTPSKPPEEPEGDAGRAGSSSAPPR